MTLPAPGRARAPLDPARERRLAYAALGDSNTAGHDERLVGLRWADLVAAAFARAGFAVTYRNLAEFGLKSHEVAERQPDQAIAMGSDIVSVVCGINDVLMPAAPDIDAYARAFDSICTRLRAALDDVVLVTATVPDLSRHIGYGPRATARVSRELRRLNDATRSLAAEHDALLADLAAREDLSTRDSYAADGYHASALGHRRMALEFAGALAASVAGGLRL
ncbi:MAG TPA: SGNH/GDSL hydrolase family protein [Thermoleophilaceae bacterium]